MNQVDHILLIIVVGPIDSVSRPLNLNPVISGDPDAIIINHKPQAMVPRTPESQETQSPSLSPQSPLPEVPEEAPAPAAAAEVPAPAPAAAAEVPAPAPAAAAEVPAPAPAAAAEVPALLRQQPRKLGSR